MSILLTKFFFKVICFLSIVTFLMAALDVQQKFMPTKQCFVSLYISVRSKFMALLVVVFFLFFFVFFLKTKYLEVTISTKNSDLNMKNK